MCAREQEMVLPPAMVNSPYNTGISSIEDSSLDDIFSNSVASVELDHQLSITLEDASKALINASHSLSKAAHEYTIAIEQITETNDEVSYMSQLRQRSLSDYSYGVQGIAHHVAYISAYVQQNFTRIRASKGSTSMETQPTNVDSKQVEEARVKTSKGIDVDYSSDDPDRQRVGPDRKRIYGWQTQPESDHSDCSGRM